MVQRPRGASFLLETAEPIRIGRKRRRENLDGDVAAEAFVLGAIHLAHAAFPERGEHFIATETSACRKHHRAPGLGSDCTLRRALRRACVDQANGCRSARLSHRPPRQVVKSVATYGDRRRLTPVFRQFASILLDSEARGRAITPVLNWLTDLQRVTPVSL